MSATTLCRRVKNDLFNLNNWVITSTGEELSYQDWIKRIPKVL